MSFLKEVGNALTHVIQWVKMTYSGFCDWIGISEWAVFGISIIIIGGIIGAKTWWRNR